PQRVTWENGRRGDKDVNEPAKKADGRRQEAEGSGQEAASGPVLPSAFCPLPSEGRGMVVNQYWTVMEQFLDLQREVMEQFLATRRGQANWGSEPPPDGRAGDDSRQIPVGERSGDRSPTEGVTRLE